MSLENVLFSVRRSCTRPCRFSSQKNNMSKWQLKASQLQSGRKQQWVTSLPPLLYIHSLLWRGQMQSTEANHQHTSIFCGLREEKEALCPGCRPGRGSEEEGVTLVDPAYLLVSITIWTGLGYGAECSPRRELWRIEEGKDKVPGSLGSKRRGCRRP